MQIDFQALKNALPIMSAVQFLRLETTEHQGKLRSACPACEEGGERALAINTKDNVFYCFAEKRGGDIIALVAHVKGITQRQAAEILYKEFTGKEATKPAVALVASEGFRELNHLATTHDQVQKFFPVNVATAIGAGFATKGLMRGLVAIPVRLPNGRLLGYIGVTEAKVPNHWNMD